MIKDLQDKIIKRAIIEKNYDEECQKWFLELMILKGNTKQIKRGDRGKNDNN